MRTRDSVTTPEDQTSTSEDHSAARDAVETLHTEGATIADKAAAAGTIRQVQETPTEAGNVRTVDKVITPKDQESAGAVNSAAASTVITEHTEGPEITDLAAAAGTIRRVEQTPTEAGNMRTRDSVTTPEDQTSTSALNAGDEETTITEHTEGPEITDLSAAAGTIRKVDQTPTEAGNMRTRDAVTSRKDQSIASVNVIKTLRQTSTIDIIDGADDPPAALTEDQYGRITVRLDKFNKYVGEKEVTVYKDDFKIPGWELGTTDYDAIHPIRTTYQGLGYKREITYNLSVLHTNSANDAITHINEGLVSTEAGSSRYEPLANGQYRAIKITEKSCTSWTPETEGDFPV